MATRIMVIDDEELIRQLLTYQLSDAGYEVCTASNGREALAQLLVEQPNLVLLDVMMPDMSGWEVCRQIRQCSTVPVIMLTAKAADGDVVTGLTAGADDYIAKPYSLAQLLARVEAVLRRGRRVSTSRLRSGGGIDRSLPDNRRSQPETAYHGQATLAPTLPRPSVEVEPAPAPEEKRTGLGQRLTEARRMRGMTLYQVEMACGIRWEFLQALEYEHFNYIPRHQLRHAIRTYSMYLGVDLRDFIKPQSKSDSQATPWPVVVSMIATGLLAVVLVVLLVVLV